jgi:hypothetical protein
MASPDEALSSPLPVRGEAFPPLTLNHYNLEPSLHRPAISLG